MADKWTAKDDADLNRDFHDFDLPAEEAEDDHVLMTVADWNCLMKANHDLWRENQSAAVLINRLRHDVTVKWASLTAWTAFFVAFGFVMGKVV